MTGVYELGVTVDSPPILSFDAYMTARWSRLVRSAVLMGADLHAAEDAVQATFVRCFFAWDRVTKTRDPDAYVHRVLINTINETKRRRWTGECPTQDMPERPVSDDTARIDDNHALLDALGALPAGQRQVVVLRYFSDFSEAQTAEALGIAVGTVKSRAARALAALAADPRLGESTEEHR